MPDELPVPRVESSHFLYNPESYMVLLIRVEGDEGSFADVYLGEGVYSRAGAEVIAREWSVDLNWPLVIDGKVVPNV